MFSVGAGYFVLHDPNIRQTGNGPKPRHSAPQGKSELCEQRVHWTCDELMMFGWVGVGVSVGI